ncbi:MAG: hypothetical protein BKP49_08885 [Treponema sp. CETP13]|nr:MAG: hypothetical protein BKP49_08885 [Treponema sp. CETP13]
MIDTLVSKSIMASSEIHKTSQKNIRKEREKKILDCAFTLFSKNGIDNTSMTEIAKKANIGVASLYRYFNTKEQIAIQCSIRTWKKMKIVFTKELSIDFLNGKTGLEICKELLGVFRKSYFLYPYFYIYIYEFDLYIKRHKLDHKMLTEYENVIKSVLQSSTAAIKRGFSDGSINPDLAEIAEPEELYTAVASSLFFLVQKLAISANLLEMDSQMSGDRKIEIVTQLFINSLKK